MGKEIKKILKNLIFWYLIPAHLILLRSNAAGAFARSNAAGAFARSSAAGAQLLLLSCGG